MERISGAIGGASGLEEMTQMLADERKRSEQHRKNYQLLKDEHARLQKDYLVLQEEMKSVLQEVKESQDLNQAALQKATVALREKQDELQRVKDKLSSGGSNNDELLRNSIRERIVDLEDGGERLQGECNRLRYENLMLKSQLEYTQSGHQRALQEITLKQELEVTGLRESLDCLRKQQSHEAEESDRKCHAAQKESVRLQAHAAELVSELEEVRAQKERLAIQWESDRKLHGRQLVEHQRNIQSLEAERASLSEQRQLLHKEVKELRERQEESMLELQAALAEKLSKQVALEDLEHRSQSERTRLRMEGLRLGEEAGQLRSQLKEMRGELERTRTVAEERSREVISFRQRESQWKRDLEKLQSSSRSVGEATQRVERLEKDLQEAVRCRTSLEDELSHLKSAKREDVVPQTSAVGPLQERLLQAQREKETLMQDVDKLRSDLKELLRDRETLVRTQSQLRQNAEQERRQYDSRVEEVERRLQDTHSKNARETQETQKKLSKYRKLIAKLRNKIQILDVQVEGIECERELLRKNVPNEVHSAVKKQLRDLQRRHLEFRQILASDRPFAYDQPTFQEVIRLKKDEMFGTTADEYEDNISEV